MKQLMLHLRHVWPTRWYPGGMPLVVNVVVLVAAAVLLASAIAGLLWVTLGRPPLRTGTAGAPWTVRDTFDGVKITLAIVGGIGAAVGLTISYRRQRLNEAAEERSKAAEHRENTRLFTDRFTKAAEQLGSDKAAVRLAGVYSMARLADDWAEDRQTCIDVLCAYLRMPYTSPTRIPTNHDLTPDELAKVEQRSREAREEQQVRLTVIKTIRDHLLPERSTPWQGSTFDFTAATFDGGDFSQIAVDGRTRLIFDKAVFSDGVVDFFGATLVGAPIPPNSVWPFMGAMTFRDATLSGGSLSFNCAKFAGFALGFQGVRFSGGTLSFASATFLHSLLNFADVAVSAGTVDFGNTTFAAGGVNYSNSTFTGGTVSFTAAKLSTSTNFGRANFAGGTVNFEHTTFSDGTVSFAGATFSDGAVEFRYAMLSGGTIQIVYTPEFDFTTFSGGVVDLRQVILARGAPYNMRQAIAAIVGECPVPEGLLLPDAYHTAAVE